MTAELQLGDESKLHMSNPFERRNLKTLLPKPTETDTLGQDEYRDVPLSAISGQSGIQVRAAFDVDHDEEDRALVESLTSDGQRVPVLLAQTASGDSPQYTSLDGHRRIAALRHIGRSHVKAIVVPGSQLVRQQAMAEGLHLIFEAAGFEWRAAGCSMCLAMNPDKLVGDQLCASSSNRNFKGRQGSPVGRTVLMSPVMVAAAAVTGAIADAREVFGIA